MYGPNWDSFVLEGLGGLLARQSFWARLCFLISIGREHNRHGARSARARCLLRAKAKAWHGANRGLHPRIWESETLLLGRWSGPASMDLGRIDCSRFLFRHGSGTDVCWCKAVFGGRDTSTIDGVWYCGVSWDHMSNEEKDERLSVPSRDREAFRHSRQGRAGCS